MKNRRISALSKGYKQRVGIAQALLGNPKVIILDEPTVGLDPIQIIEIRDLIKQLGQKHTVILSSHILSEVQTICEKILIIAKGKLIAFDEADKLENQLSPSNEISLLTEADEEETREILAEATEALGGSMKLEETPAPGERTMENFNLEENEEEPQIDEATEISELVESEKAEDTDEATTEILRDISLAETEDHLTRVQLTTQHDNIYEVSRTIFFAFAKRERALLEMSLKKANLEDIFIELTREDDKS
jgi:ABC-2 type transport system ATP-binding protein